MPVTEVAEVANGMPWYVWVLLVVVAVVVAGVSHRIWSSRKGTDGPRSGKNPGDPPVHRK